MTRRPGRQPITCGQCGSQTTSTTTVLEQQLCRPCLLRFRRAAGTCPGCAGTKVLAFYDATRRPSCASCTGNPPVYACPRCGREDSSYGTLCAPCTLHDRVTVLLGDDTGTVVAALRPVQAALLAAARPQSTLYWLTRASATGPHILARMASGELPISHQTFDALPAGRSTDYLRNLLTAAGVLPPYNPGIERIPRWLTGVLAPLPQNRADMLERFVRWQLLHRLRRLHDRDAVTRSSVGNARATVLTAVRFLAWLDGNDLTLSTANQAALDSYLVAHPGRAATLAPFLGWANRARLSSTLTVPTPPRAAPQVLLSDDQRWRQIELLLHQQHARPYLRVAGLLTLLFAQPLSTVCRMTVAQVSTEPTRVTVSFGDVAIELPPLFDDLVRGYLTADRQPTYPSRPDP